jgi:hypothetical protein
MAMAPLLTLHLQPHKNLQRMSAQQPFYAIDLRVGFRRNWMFSAGLLNRFPNP